MLCQAMAGGSRGSGLPATRLPSPGTCGGFNAGMRGNGGQVAMAVCDFGPMTSRRPARHCHVSRHCSYPASVALAGGWQAGNAGGRQGGLVLAWVLFRIYAFLCQLNFLPASPFFFRKVAILFILG